MRESQIEKALVRRVKLLGGEVRKVSWVNRHGAPDRLLLLPPEIIENLPGYREQYMRPVDNRVAWQHPLVELKRPGKEAEDHQAREHVRLRAAGFVVLVIDSLEAVDRWLPTDVCI